MESGQPLLRGREDERMLLVAIRERFEGVSASLSDW
jgi:hypothetical protein